uniref:centrosomal protein of 126 kDa isoform X2 n=1 Tax=Gasterosteus aculeatus aculeatus TaxID=481459 RepID=UPI001A9864F5|nr:centrosomal protein of 126 kDa isoform X2 [Gasterosteus aculeatus aculeatus]
MQDVQGAFFYHSNPRLGTNGGLEDERQLLVEEQKLCRSRARKFSLETNRRRRALEQRQKQRDVQEQQLTENILLQRRQRVQDATERFQRAHLPPSQRRRQSFRRNVPNIEDALNQIQGSSPFSFLSGNSNISSCTPCPRQALSAVEAYTKLLHEQSRTCFNSCPQREKTHNLSPQDSQVSDCSNSESFSSKDSLENENHSIKHLQYSNSPFVLDSEKPRPDPRKQNDLCPTSDLTSFSSMILLADKLHEPEQKKRTNSEGPDNKLHVSEASWGFTPKTQTLHNCNLFTLCEVATAGPEQFGVNSQNSPSDNVIATNRVAPGNTTLDSSCLRQEALLGLGQNNVLHDRQLKHPSATEILLPAQNDNSKDILCGPPPKPNIFLNVSATDNASRETTLTEKDNHNLLPQKELRASVNNLNKVSNSQPKSEEPVDAASLQRACLSDVQSDTLTGLGCPEGEAENVPVAGRTSRSVRFIKGILKKPSWYMPGETTSGFAPGHLIFAKQVALAIRDSVELARTKSKGVEGHTAVKKKLRWFDEEHVEKEGKEQNTMEQMKGASSNHSYSNNYSKDHQLSLTTVSGATKTIPGVTPAASTGYHFTKQAWADVGVQVSLPQEQAEEVKVPRCGTRTAGPKVPQRERPARAGGGPVSSRTRKGTVIRPQSATEVSQIARTQGGLMVPRPPPKMEGERRASLAKAPYGAERCSVNRKHAEAEQEAEGPPHTRDAVRTDSTVMYTPLPPSRTHSASKGKTKGPPSSGRQQSQGCGRRRRGMVCNDKGHCLACTPTDEEISQLWHGVRSALATKEAKNMLQRQALDLVVRKLCVEQSRPPPGSGNRRVPSPSQPKGQTIPVGPFSSTYNMACPYEGLDSAAQLHLAGGHPGGLVEESDMVAAVETAQTQRPGTAQQRSRKEGLAGISLEEQNILFSLDRLNQRLHRVREHVGSDAGSCGLALIDAPCTGEVRVTNHQKHRASNSRSRYQKKP